MHFFEQLRSTENLLGEATENLKALEALAITATEKQRLVSVVETYTAISKSIRKQKVEVLRTLISCVLQIESCPRCDVLGDSGTTLTHRIFQEDEIYVNYPRGTYVSFEIPFDGKNDLEGFANSRNVYFYKLCELLSKKIAEFLQESKEWQRPEIEKLRKLVEDVQKLGSMLPI